MFFLGTLADDTPCRNSQIQRGTYRVSGPLDASHGHAHIQQKLEVKMSSWGLGSFLAEAAKAGDLITGTHSRYHVTV